MTYHSSKTGPTPTAPTSGRSTPYAPLASTGATAVPLPAGTSPVGTSPGSVSRVVSSRTGGIASPLGKKISTDDQGRTTCLCSDGVTYINCGRNCDCCNNIKKKVKGESKVPSWSTVSCPCSSYAVLNIAGDIECEMDFLNSKHRLKAMVLKNHTIDRLEPRLRDQWICENNSLIPCSQGEIKWDTMHVVSSVANEQYTRVALHNSKTSTENCYIPKSTLSEYGSVETLNREEDLQEIYGVDIDSETETFNDALLFDTKDQATLWNYIRGSRTTEYSEFINDNGITKYFPGKYYPKQKLINSCSINGRDMIGFSVGSNWNYEEVQKRRGKDKISNLGEDLEIIIKGENQPVVDISIKNSFNRSILKRKLKGIVVNGDYRLKIRIPRLVNSKKQEAYNIKITPSADTKWYTKEYSTTLSPVGAGSPRTTTGVINYTFWQFNNVKLSYTSSSSSLANTNTAGMSADFSGAVDNTSILETPITHRTSVTRSSGSQNYYVIKKGILLEDVLTEVNTIKRTIIDQEDKKELECRQSLKLALALDPSDVDKFNDVTGGYPQSLSLEHGMIFTSKVEKTREVSKSISLDNREADDCNDEDVLDIFTNEFELLDGTGGLFSDMIVTGVGVDGYSFSTVLQSVDCSKSITLQSHHAINNGSSLVFKHNASSVVDRVEGDTVHLQSCVRLPNKSELEFSRGAQSTRGHLTFDDDGAAAINVTTTFEGFTFGRFDESFSLNMDLIVTNTPPAHDQHISVERNSSVSIDFLKFNSNTNKSDMVINTGALPSNGLLKALDVPIARYLKYTPAADFTGHDKFTFNISDEAGERSEEKTIFITIK